MSVRPFPRKEAELLRELIRADRNVEKAGLALDRTVVRCKRGGCSFAQIGAALGVTRQAAAQFYANASDRVAAARPRATPAPPERRRRARG